MKKYKFLPDWVKNGMWLIISVSIAFILWSFISSFKNIGSVFVPPLEVWNAFIKTSMNGYLWENVMVSLVRVLGGFSLGVICSIPVGFFLGWYEPFRRVVEPWIQFLRTIPPIALIPLVITAVGIGTAAKITIIFFAVFLTMVITIYQGVKNVDVTLIKAARVFDATDADLFFHVIVPAAIPYIFTGVRLGVATALTTLIAAELTGAAKGIGTMIQKAGMYFEMDVVLLGIIVIGIIGFVFDKIVLFLERHLTSWQEVKDK